MGTRTKVICTIGPSVNSFDKILDLIHAGMDVARLNFSHGTHEEHLETIRLLKRAREDLNTPLAIMLDTKGPEIRLGKIKGGEIFLCPGHKWHLIREHVVGDAEKVTITPGPALDGIKKGDRVLFDDGYISSHVVETTTDGLIVEIDNGGIISSEKGVNVPNVNLNLPATTERDCQDIRFGCEHDIDIIAASFVRSVEHVVAVKKLLKEANKPEILVIAKIENSEGVDNFDGIVEVADGIMIARGDLGVEVPLEQVPKLQKMMIRKSYLAGKPVVTATQMLESMMHNPRPTRAEVSDIANAIYDSTSAVMLSGETAVGHYPIETVKTMKRIIEEAEADFNYQTHFNLHTPLVYADVPSAVTLATVKTSYSSNARAIFAFTSGGGTARLLSRLRPEMPIVTMTPNEKTYHQMAFNWGVIPFKCPESQDFESAFSKISEFAVRQKIVSNGDLVVVTAGVPFGISGTTNMMIVESIGDVLIRAHQGYGERVHGKIVMVLMPEEKSPYFCRDQLVVINKCDESYLPIIKEAKGVILQNRMDDLDSEKFAIEFAKELGKSFLVRADGAFQILKEGQLATLDPEKAIVYKGVLI